MEIRNLEKRVCMISEGALVLLVKKGRKDPCAFLGLFKELNGKAANFSELVLLKPHEPPPGNDSYWIPHIKSYDPGRDSLLVENVDKYQAYIGFIDLVSAGIKSRKWLRPHGAFINELYRMKLDNVMHTPFLNN